MPNHDEPYPKLWGCLPRTTQADCGWTGDQQVKVGNSPGTCIPRGGHSKSRNVTRPSPFPYLPYKRGRVEHTRDHDSLVGYPQTSTECRPIEKAHQTCNVRPIAKVAIGRLYSPLGQRGLALDVCTRPFRNPDGIPCGSMREAPSKHAHIALTAKGRAYSHIRTWPFGIMATKGWRRTDFD